MKYSTILYHEGLKNQGIYDIISFNLMTKKGLKNMSKQLADLFFSKLKYTMEQLEEMFPLRQLPEGAKVTRIAPSPTGFIHLGNLFGAVIDERLAHQSGGIFYLRIEDTDLKRQVEGGVEAIIDALDYFGLKFDEGATADPDNDNGAYGPYRQRQRKDFYHTYAKYLVEIGKAYPCFCTEEELEEMRNKQQELKENFGYYGKWAKYRDADFDTVKAFIDAGTPYVLRYKSEGDPAKKKYVDDLVKGKLEFPENEIDHVLLKSDGIPTYHFAHVVDDHLMRTTHVVRGEEWLPTLPFHVQLFETLGFKMPKYIHTSQLMKMDGESKRKLSKRKDPEFSLDFYKQEGIPVKSAMEYLLTILNSNFEEWRRANPDAGIDGFQFTTKKMGVSGMLFDVDKLKDVSKNAISRFTADEVYEEVCVWAEEYDKEFYTLLVKNGGEVAKSIFQIGRGGNKPRKDIALWGEVKDYMGFIYDEIFNPVYEYPASIAKEDLKAVLSAYKYIYSDSDEQQGWFDKIKELAVKFGFAAETKLYKANPEQYKGHVGDVSMVLRVVVTGKQNSPDLWEIMKILGRDKVLERIDSALKNI